MDRYAVMGNPVSHSKSPAIHAQFAAACAQQLSYSAIHVEKGGFRQAVADFFAGGGKGLNVTVPFKQEAWALADLRSEQAEYAGAVNTLFMDEQGRLHGHNTDGIGLVRDIRDNQNGSLRGKSILILGAGGASRGILLPLLLEQPARIVIANRTLAKAEELLATHGTLLPAGTELAACGLDKLQGMSFDWLINATSASLQGQLPDLPASLLKPGAWCYDLMYASTETPFCAWAKKAGAAKALDGLGMLVEQAAESFFLWRGVRPQTAAVLANLREQMQG